MFVGDDAVEAVNHGAAAILVSNHGARQMDGEPSTVRRYLYACGRFLVDFLQAETIF